MKKIHFLFIIALVGFFQISLAQDTFGLLWTPEVKMDKQLFPSYIWANASRDYVDQYELYEDEAHQYYRGDSEGQLGISFVNLNSKGYKIKVIIECNDIMESSTYETYASGDITKFVVYPEISYKWDFLLNNLQPRPVSIKYSVEVDGKPDGTQTKTISLRPINECPFLFIDKNENLVDLNFMYAAYVNENNPRIANEILPEIRRQGVIDQIIGYQGGKIEVYNQVFAVWNYFRSKGIGYSSLNSPGLNLNDIGFPFVQQQYVRTLDDALNTAQANCVDGTVAMASVLYRMGIQPIIVTTPSHCFLAFMPDPEVDEIDFLETTSLGTRFATEDLDSIPNIIDVYNSELDAENYDSYRSFLIAVYQGRTNYHSESDMFNSYGRLDALKFLTDENTSELITKLQYQLYMVDKFRQEGLIPIPGGK